MGLSSVSFNALLLDADTESLLLSSVKNKLIGQVVDHIVALGIQLLNVKLFDAVMASKFVSSIVLVAYLAHNFDLWAISLDVIIELSSCQVLILLSIANITAKFRARILSMCLEFSKSLPDDFATLSFLIVASMWELTEINTVSKNLVDLLHEISSSLAVRAADVVLWGELLSNHFTILVHDIFLDDISLSINELFMGYHE
jgi:hypothetical protein